jgi:hypothetical protein
MKVLTQCFILLFVLISFGIKAQGRDTSVFFRYAATFDQLLPSQHYPGDIYVPDSSFSKMMNFEPKNVTLTKHVQFATYRSGLGVLEDGGTTEYKWDKEGRMINLREIHYGDTTTKLNIAFRFLIRNNMQMIVRSSGRNLDTTAFVYNRSGWVGTWKRHVITFDTNYTITGTRMYDSRGNLIVLTNANYGPLNGSYTYEYDKWNRLVRRCFLSGGSGVILCSDTLIYSPLVSDLTQLVTHELQVAGTGAWVLLESKQEFMHNHQQLLYSDFNDADTNYVYKNIPSYNIQFDYDGDGYLQTETFGTLLYPDMISAKYFYGQNHRLDSITFRERIVDKKTEINRVYSTEVREYDAMQRLTKRTITSYLFEEKRKKDKQVPTEVVTITFSWK